MNAVAGQTVWIDQIFLCGRKQDQMKIFTGATSSSSGAGPEFTTHGSSAPLAIRKKMMTSKTYVDSRSERKISPCRRTTEILVSALSDG